MHVISANVVVADIATELDLTFSEASLFFESVLDEEDRDDGEEEDI